jgi:hypothetical protein
MITKFGEMSVGTQFTYGYTGRVMKKTSDDQAKIIMPAWTDEISIKGHAFWFISSAPVTIIENPIKE